MGLFDFLKQKIKIDTAETLKKEAASISNVEKKYYQKDSYYQAKAYQGTVFERDIITFDEYKTKSIPSENGLFVPEILMLHFCNKYPNPKNGYPGYWWYKYGIRDVGAIFSSLVYRGFLELDEEKGKYKRTALGEEELQNNQYVPYMHSHSKYTTFTIWDLNRMIGNSEDKSNYIEIIENKHNQIADENKKQTAKEMHELKKTHPDLYVKLSAQDKQLEDVKQADEKYRQDNDLNSIILFWEKIWDKGGPLFEGSGWMFTLPDLYIKAQCYDKAIALCKRIKKERQSYYSDKADKYIERIQKLMKKN